MKKNLCICTALLVLLGSCASLTSSQVAAVNQFALTSAHFSAYPSKIMRVLADIRVKRGVYFANSLEDTDPHIEELNNLYVAMTDDYKSSAKADITFKIIDKYAKALLLLSSDKHAADLDSQARTFGTDLNSLITTYNNVPGVTPVPGGLGGVVGSLILAGGKQLIRTKQARAIREFVPRSDTLIEVMTDNLLEFLESTNIDFLIKNEERGIQSNYKSFLNQKKPVIQNERDYLELKGDLDQVKKLRSQTIAATHRLRNAHASLLAALQEKKDLKEVIANLQTLYDSVSDVKSTLQQMDVIKN
ncbi:MAG: hypothetical protein ABI813_11965 [Bacteroidota bacterium]